MKPYWSIKKKWRGERIEIGQVQVYNYTDAEMQADRQFAGNYTITRAR